MTLDTDYRSEPGQVPLRQDLEEEYRRLLSYQKIEDLRNFARGWGLRLRGTRKSAIADQLAVWLADPDVIRAHLRDLDDLGLQVLTFLHLVLTPDYGLSADNIVRGMIRQQERTSQHAQGTDLLSADTPIARGAPGERRHAAIQERVATLNRWGLLLPFRQGSAVYYALPTAVRLCLPSRPELFAGHNQADLSAVQEIAIGQRVQMLYAIWTALAGGLPGTDKPLSRQALPPRHPIEDTWASLQDWNNDPDEISEIASGRYSSERSLLSTPGRFSTGAFHQGLTVAAPPNHLSDDDLAFMRERTGCPGPEIEFCYVLLEALGALSGAPGQPVSAHNEAMYRFLRSSFTDKVRVLWQAWTTGETWSEMDMVLRTAVPGMAPLRLRRSLAYPEFKPGHLYTEWRYARQSVLRFLSLLDEGRWVSIDGFLRAVYSICPDLLHNRTDSSIWRLESPRTGKQFGTTIEDWQQGHGQFVLAMLQGPLYWLGLIRLGYSAGTPHPPAESPTPEAFQLTSTGAFALGKRAELPTDALDTGLTPLEGIDALVCSVADDLTITLRPGHTPVELYDLAHAVGSLVDAAPDRFVYRLTAHGVLHWAEAIAGTARQDAIETLIATLSRYCAPPGAQPDVAADWQHKLRTWAENYGRLHIYENLTLLELADDYVLQELLASIPLREHIVYQFSPRLVAIQDSAVDGLVQEMEKRGYTPRVK